MEVCARTPAYPRFSRFRARSSRLLPRGVVGGFTHILGVVPGVECADECFERCAPNPHFGSHLAPGGGLPRGWFGLRALRGLRGAPRCLLVGLEVFGVQVPRVSRPRGRLGFQLFSASGARALHLHPHRRRCLRSLPSSFSSCIRNIFSSRRSNLGL